MSDLKQMSGDEFLSWLPRAQNILPPRDSDIVEQELLAQRMAEVPSLIRRIPKFLQRGTLKELYASVNDPKIAKAVRDFDLTCGHVLLMGDLDTGKSTGAGVIVRRMIVAAAKSGGHDWDYVQKLRWFSSRELCRACKAHQDWRGHDCAEWQQAVTASILIVDEVGKEPDTEVLKSILEARFDRAEGHMIFTSNFNFKQLRKLYEDTIIKRMLKANNRQTIRVEAFKSPTP